MVTMIEIENNSSVDKKLRKWYICKKTGKCTRCPMHDKENRKKRSKPDRYKNKRN